MAEDKKKTPGDAYQKILRALEQLEPAEQKRVIRSVAILLDVEIAAS